MMIKDDVTAQVSQKARVTRMPRVKNTVKNTVLVKQKNPASNTNYKRKM